MTPDISKKRTAFTDLKTKAKHQSTVNKPATQRNKPEDLNPRTDNHNNSQNCNPNQNSYHSKRTPNQTPQLYLRNEIHSART
jgi:hypothetical protein